MLWNSSISLTLVFSSSNVPVVAESLVVSKYNVVYTFVSNKCIFFAPHCVSVRKRLISYKVRMR